MLRLRDVILKEGWNCWRIAEARRAAFLVDAASYFSALRTAITRAERQILIVGWDIDSRARLVPEPAPDGGPCDLRSCLAQALGQETGAAEALRLVLEWRRPFGRWNPFSWSGEVLERLDDTSLLLELLGDVCPQLLAVGHGRGLARQEVLVPALVGALRAQEDLRREQQDRERAHRRERGQRPAAPELLPQRRRRGSRGAGGGRGTPVRGAGPYLSPASRRLSCRNRNQQ